MHKIQNPHRPTGRYARTLLSLAGAALSAGAFAQTAPAAATAPAPAAAEEDVVILSPFEVTSEATSGYAAATTLAGNRLNTELRDIGSSVSVVTSEFLKDVGATDNQSLLQYTTGAEVGGTMGNFAGTGDGALLDESSKFINPNQNTRVRGLTSADNTRDFFMTDIPWDGYSVDGVDLQRGPNSILFGQGSPAGIINTRTKQAMFRNANEVSLRVGSYGANRQSIDLNRVLIEDQLALRIAAVRNDDQFKQDPAFSKAERVFGALRFEPAFLKKNGMRTILKANYEAGRVRSNNPRVIPPVDMITPWFKTGTYTGTLTAAGANWGKPVTYNNLNRETFTPVQVVDDNTGRPNHGQIRPTINGGVNNGNPNPAYNPWVGNFAQQYGGPMVYFNQDSADQVSMWHNEPAQQFQGGLRSDGAIDRVITGQMWQRPSSISPYSNYARNAGLPYYLSGVYKNFSITDSSVFDFYNNLIDGPNKKEWQDFRAYNVSLSQTFFDEQVGFELVYNNERYSSGRLGLLSGGDQGIYVDINSVMSNGTTTGLNGDPYTDGTPNPNVGRAFLSDNGQGANSSLVSEKETTRATVFATHDFSKDGKSWALKLLGKHTVTGMAAVDEDERDNRTWIRYTADQNFADWVARQYGEANPRRFDDNYLVPNSVIYLGSTLKNATSASGAYLPAPTAAQTPSAGMLNTFIGIWNKTDVDPAAFWGNNYYPNIAPFNQTGGAYLSFQSENPANYVGWSQVPLSWVDSEASPENRVHNTTLARKTKSRVTSSAFVWQGHFWDNALVGTWGVRKDIAKSWTESRDIASVYGANRATRGVANLSPDAFYLQDAYNFRKQVTSHSWMIVGHLNDFPGLKQLMEKSPVIVSLFYNKSSNFQPSSNRIDIYGEPLAAPVGNTTDKGILLETRDGKYSLKINKYETIAENATSDSIGGSLFAIGQLQAWSSNWANRFQYNWTGDSSANAVASPSLTNNQYNFGPSPVENEAATAAGFVAGTAEFDTEIWRLAAVREAAAVAGWRAWQAQIDPRFITQWMRNYNALTTATGYSTPPGVAATEDSKSSGYEAEFNAQVTKNWRLTFNATRTSAQRYNLGGAALNDFVTKYEKALNTTPAGDLRIWWGGAGNETTLYQWNVNFGTNYHLLQNQDGSDVPELRKWRFNMITNYEFDQGVLKGFNVGGGVRYESSIVIGYPVLPKVGYAGQGYYDVSNPYRGEGETNFDLWVGYTRKVWKGVEWNIQLNVRNAFVGNEITPVTTQPDGTVAGVRIRPPQTWQLTNTFKF